MLNEMVEQFETRTTQTAGQSVDLRGGFAQASAAPVTTPAVNADFSGLAAMAPSPALSAPVQDIRATAGQAAQQSAEGMNAMRAEFQNTQAQAAKALDVNPNHSAANMLNPAVNGATWGLVGGMAMINPATAAVFATCAAIINGAEIISYARQDRASRNEAPELEMPKAVEGTFEHAKKCAAANTQSPSAQIWAKLNQDSAPAGKADMGAVECTRQNLQNIMRINLDDTPEMRALSGQMAAAEYVNEILDARPETIQVTGSTIEAAMRMGMISQAAQAGNMSPIAHAA